MVGGKQTFGGQKYTKMNNLENFMGARLLIEGIIPLSFGPGF